MGLLSISNWTPTDKLIDPNPIQYFSNFTSET